MGLVVSVLSSRVWEDPLLLFNVNVHLPALLIASHDSIVIRSVPTYSTTGSRIVSVMHDTIARHQLCRIYREPLNAPTRHYSNPPVPSNHTLNTLH